MVTKRERAQLEAAARDRYLRFGLVGVPVSYAEPITGALEGCRFEDLPTPDAARVLEGLVYVQWPKSGVVGLLVAPLLAIANYLPPTATTIGYAGGMPIMLVLPAYMVIVGVVQLIIKRRARRYSVPVSSRPILLATLRLAPYAAIVLATALGRPLASP